MQTEDNEKINALLKMAEDYTHRILKSSLSMREDELMEKRKQQKIKKG